MICPHCQKEFNAGKVMGSAKTPKKTAAAKKRGEFMKRAFANQKKMEGTGPVVPHSFKPGPPQSFVDPEFEAKLKKDNPALSGGFIAPKGSFSKDDLKSMLRDAMNSGSSRLDEGFCAAPDLQNVPRAPFDFNDEEGNPHRVRAYGKQLKVCFLRDGVEEPIRNLAEGELERLWERRIIK